MITMAEIARLTGVSQPTVSRVLSGNAAVNPDVRERVLACARAHNYQPNALAKSLHGRQTHLLGVLLTDISNGFFAELAKELEACAKRAGYSIILLNSGRDEKRERECIDIVRRYRVDGVAAVPIRADSALWSKDVHRLELPVTAVTLRVPGLDSVYTDHAAAGEAAAAHLLERGYDDFLFAGPPGDEKGAGFFRALAACGKSAEELETVSMTSAETVRERLAARLSRGSGRRLGIFACNDLDALILLNLLRVLNVSVPGRAGVIGFDDIPVSRYLNPSLTSISQPLAEMAGRTVERLTSRIERPYETDGILDCPLQAAVAARESTGAKRPEH